jgi:CzcA family heavy metal efflux pump
VATTPRTTDTVISAPSQSPAPDGRPPETPTLIDGVIQWSLNNRALILAATVALVVWGVLQTQRMPVDVFPDLTAPTVTVLAEAHGMAPEEVERLVTFPIESAVNGASGVRRVRSATSVGVTTVWVEFEWGTDIFKARQIVSERLQLARAALPADISPPVLAPISSIMGEILFIGLTADASRAREIRTLADWDLRRRLLAVPGVSQVVPIGGSVQQFQVRVRPGDLLRHGVTLDDVVDAVAATNENASAGFLERAGQASLIYVVGRAERTEQVALAVVKPHPIAPVRVLDVADVIIGDAIKLGDAAINGREGVILGIQKQPDVNTLALTARLDTVLESIDSSLPKGVKLHRSLLRQSDFIGAGVDNVTHALRDGSILVILIIGLFLLSGRATLITALAIPLSLLTAVLVLDAMGATLNTMTLGGMAIAVGALVDDAIIDVENVVRRLRERRASSDKSGPGTLRIVFEASREIRSSIVFATLIIVLVFVPLFFLDGVEGRLLQPLGFAYVISLGASLLVALTVTPVLCSILLPTSRMVLRGLEPAPIRVLRRAYEPLLAIALRHWAVLVIVSVASVAGATVAAVQTGRTFLPEFNEGSLTVSVVTLPGTALKQSNALGRQVEALMLAQPEVVSTALRTGRAELDEHAQATHSSEVEVQLKMADRSEGALLAAMRESFKEVHGVAITIGQPISHRIDHMLSGTRANIAVKIFGPELGQLKRTGAQVEAVMAKVAGVVDLSVEQQGNLPLTTVRLKRDALASYSLSVRDVAESVETAFYGRTVSSIRVGAYAFDLVVRYPENAREDLDAIRATMIPTPTGAWVPLEAVAEIRRDRGASQITRENGQRKLVVMCNVGEGAALGTVVADIQAQVAANIRLPSGYTIAYGGQFQAATEASKTLLWLGFGVVIGIFGLLLMALSSARDALLVMSNLPLALIGGVVGVYVGGGIISVASIIGFITLFGIATRNGIMMVTHIRHLMTHEGVTDPVEAVKRGASERLAPILMTALASGLGLLPLALAIGEPGSEIQAPMALVILFGLISSTVLNMFVVPAVMLRFGSVRKTSVAGSYSGGHRG